MRKKPRDRSGNHKGEVGRRLDAVLAQAVAAKLLDLGEEMRARLAAVEGHHPVAALEGGVHQVTAEEERAAEDQEVHVVRIRDGEPHGRRGLTASIDETARDVLVRVARSSPSTGQDQLESGWRVEAIHRSRTWPCARSRGR
jgi:hypothetical protein